MTLCPKIDSKKYLAIASFMEYYSQHRYHNSPGNVTPDEVYHSRRKSILTLRKEGGKAASITGEKET